MNEILGYFLILIVGITLGMMGSGGSILTVPTLVYTLGIAPSDATTYSLFLIGMTSIFASYTKFKNKEIDFGLVLRFGLPSMVSIFLTRSFILPLIPEFIEIPFLGEISTDTLLMMLFSVVMVAAGWNMMRKKSDNEVVDEMKKSNGSLGLILLAISIGFLSGILGAGGGFLIIPSLMIFAKVSLRKAIAASIVIVMLNSLIGFAGDYQQFSTLNYQILGFLLIFSVVGVFLGNYWGKKIQTQTLQRGFGYFVLALGFLLFFIEMDSVIN